MTGVRTKVLIISDSNVEQILEKSKSLMEANSMDFNVQKWIPLNALLGVQRAMIEHVRKLRDGPVKILFGGKGGRSNGKCLSLAGEFLKEVASNVGGAANAFPWSEEELCRESGPRLWQCEYFEVGSRTLGIP